MATAFVDMVGLLIVVPLLPYYVTRLGGGGLVLGVLVSSYSVAQLLSAPLWGRVSDRYGRRPALLVSLASSAAAYVVFGYAESIGMLLLSRLVQGGGGGTVGVVQAYVADVAAPRDRAKSLGWLSAATSAGVMVGPALGSFAARYGQAAPGLAAAGLCVFSLVFAGLFLPESRPEEDEGDATPRIQPRQAVRRVISHPGEPASRLIWIYTLGMAAFQSYTAVLVLFLAARYGVEVEDVGWFFVYVGTISLLTRAVFLGRAVDRLGEARLSRVGMTLLAAGLLLLPFTSYAPWPWVALAVAAALVPLGTAFTFPCISAILSHVIARRERGTMMGVQQSFGGMARVVAPLWAGFAWDRLGAGVPFWTGAAVVGAAFLLGLGIDAYTADAQAAAGGEGAAA